MPSDSVPEAEPEPVPESEPIPSPHDQHWLCPVRRNVWLLVVLALHLAFGFAYAEVIPYRQAGVSSGQYLKDIGAPDERQHVNLIRTLAAGEPYPVLRPNAPDFSETYQSHQPPAFYVLSATVLKIAGLPQDEKQEGRILRGVNVVIGTLTVLATFFLALWSTQRPRVALIASMIVALVPMNLALSASVSNDPLLYLATTVCLAGLARGWRMKWDAVALVMAVLGAGLAMLTKTSGLLLLLPLLITALWPKPGAPIGVRVALILAPILIVSPWLMRNQQVYGEPLGTRTFAQAFRGAERKTSPLRTYLAKTRFASRLTETTAKASTGVFGYFDIHYPERVAVLAWLVVILFSFGVLVIISDPAYREMWPWAGCLLAFMGVVALSYIAFNLRYDQPQPRYVFSALPILATGMAITLARFHLRYAALWGLLYVAVNLVTFPMLEREFFERIDRLRVAESERWNIAGAPWAPDPPADLRDEAPWLREEPPAAPPVQLPSR